MSPRCEVTTLLEPEEAGLAMTYPDPVLSRDEHHYPPTTAEWMTSPLASDGEQGHALEPEGAVMRVGARPALWRRILSLLGLRRSSPEERARQVESDERMKEFNRGGTRKLPVDIPFGQRAGPFR